MSALLDYLYIDKRIDKICLLIFYLSIKTIIKLFQVILYHFNEVV